MKRLEEQGVIFVRLVDDAGVESYAAVYKGEVLTNIGDSKRLKQELRSAWNKTGDDLAKELEELKTLNQLDYLEKISTAPPGGTGYLGGQRLNRAQIRKWIKEIDLISQSKASLRIVPEGADILKGNRAGFNPFSTELFLQIGMTQYEIFHEFKHLEEFIKIGKEEYIKGMKAIGGSLEANIIRTYKRERYVYDAIIENAHLFNKAEIAHATDYIDYIILELSSKGINHTKL